MKNQRLLHDLVSSSNDENVLKWLRKDPSLIEEQSIRLNSASRTNIVGYYLAQDNLNLLEKIKKEFPKEYQEAIINVGNNESVFLEILLHDENEKITYQIMSDSNSKREKNTDIKRIKFCIEQGLIENIKTLLKSSRFSQHFSIEKNPDFLNILKDIVSLKDFLYQDKSLNTKFIKNMEYAHSFIKDKNKIEFLFNHVEEEDKVSIMLYLASLNISKPVADFFKATIASTESDKRELLFTLLKNRDFSQKDFMDIYQNDIFAMEKEERIEIIAQGIFLMKSEVVISIIEDNPELLKEEINNILVRDLWINEKKIKKINLNDNSLKDDDTFEFFLRSDTEEEKLVSYFMDKYEMLSQEQALKIIDEQYSLYRSKELLQKTIVLLKKSGLELDKTNLWKHCYKRTDSQEVLNYIETLKCSENIGNSFIYLLENNKEKTINYYMSNLATPLQRGMFATLYSMRIIEDRSNNQTAREIMSNLLNNDIDINILTKNDIHLVEVGLTAIKRLEHFHFERNTVCMEEIFMNKILSALTKEELNTIKSKNKSLTEIVLEQATPKYLLSLIENEKINVLITDNVNQILNARLDEDTEIFTNIMSRVLKGNVQVEKLNMNKINRL